MDCFNGKLKVNPEIWTTIVQDNHSHFLKNLWCGWANVLLVSLGFFQNFRGKTHQSTIQYPGPRLREYLQSPGAEPRRAPGHNGLRQRPATTTARATATTATATNMVVSWNGGTPKSSKSWMTILVLKSVVLESPILRNPHIYLSRYKDWHTVIITYDHHQLQR